MASPAVAASVATLPFGPSSKGAAEGASPSDGEMGDVRGVEGVDEPEEERAGTVAGAGAGLGGGGRGRRCSGVMGWLDVTLSSLPSAFSSLSRYLKLRSGASSTSHRR
jgi:hypothetical protein